LNGINRGRYRGPNASVQGGGGQLGGGSLRSCGLMGLLGRAPRARYEGMQHENNATPRIYWRRHSKELSMKLTLFIRFNRLSIVY